MPSSSSGISSNTASTAFFPVVPVDRPDGAYSSQPGQPKASQLLRFAPCRKSGTSLHIKAAQVRASMRHTRAEAKDPQPVRTTAGAAESPVNPRPLSQMAMYTGRVLENMPAADQPVGFVSLKTGLPSNFSDSVSSPPPGLFSADTASQPNVPLEHAVEQVNASATSSPASPQSTDAAPIRRAAARALGALGSIGHALHEGISATGHGCRRAYDAVHDRCAAMVRKTPAKADASRPPESPLAPLVRDVAHLIRRDDLLNIMVRFSGADMTYEKLLYLTMNSTGRKLADEAGKGFNAPVGGTSDPLCRRLVSTLENSDNPWHILGALVNAHPELIVARERYLAYRNEHYPDFKDMHNRLRGLADPKPLAAIEANLKAKRAESEEQGVPFDIDAYILDNPLDPENRYPVTARQLSADLLRLQKCLLDLATVIEKLDLADCLEEHRRRQRTGAPADGPQHGMPAQH